MPADCSGLLPGVNGPLRATDWRYSLSKKKDPYDTYEWLDSLHLYCRVRAYYFFLLAANKKNTIKISPLLIRRCRI